MFNLLKRLFSSSDALARLGRRGDSMAFARRFSEMDIVILSLPIADSLEPSNVNHETLLSLTEKAAKAMSDDAPVTPFTYQDGSVTVCPVFTSQKGAEAFVGKYSITVNRVTPFMLATVQGRVLAPLFPSAWNVVLNAQLDDNYPLSEQDLEVLRRLNILPES